MDASRTNCNTWVERCQHGINWKIRGSVKHIKQGKHMSIKWRDKPTRNCIRRIDKDNYVYINPDGTMDVRQYSREHVRKVASARRSFENLKQLIRTNFSQDDGKACFITLTYRENMRDKVRLMHDFDVFYKRLRRCYTGHKFKYIAVAEPQARGAWHMHVLLADVDGWNLWIPQQLLSEKWGQGRVWIQRLKSDDVGAYYTAYFTALTDSKHEVYCLDDVTVSPPSKKIIKGSRLKFYDSGMKLYRCSRNINAPEIVVEDEIHVPDGSHVIYTRAYEVKQIEGNTTRVVNRIWHADIKPSNDKQDV